MIVDPAPEAEGQEDVAQPGGGPQREGAHGAGDQAGGQGGEGGRRCRCGRRCHGGGCGWEGREPPSTLPIPFPLLPAPLQQEALTGQNGPDQVLVRVEGRGRVVKGGGEGPGLAHEGRVGQGQVQAAVDHPVLALEGRGQGPEQPCAAEGQTVEQGVEDGERQERGEARGIPDEEEEEGGDQRGRLAADVREPVVDLP